jgi:hypothetical protein
VEEEDDENIHKKQISKIFSLFLATAAVVG